MLSTDYKFQISVYLRLAEMLPAKDRAKREYYENIIEDLLEKQILQDNSKYIPDEMKDDCYIVCEKILAEYGNYPKKSMTISEIIETYSDLKKFDCVAVGKALTKLGFPSKVVKPNNEKTKRIRMFPFFETE